MLNLIVALVLSSNVASADALRQHVGYLASPELEGRMTLSPGIDKAAEYVAKQFKEAGLKPGNGRGYFHDFEVAIGKKATKDSRLEFEERGKTTKYRLQTEFVPLEGSWDNQTIYGKVVDVGDGSEAAYEGKAVRGNVVVLDAGPFANGEPATNGAKAKIAADKGAIGMIVLYRNGDGKRGLPPLNRGEGIPADLKLVAVAADSDKFWVAVPGTSGNWRAAWASRLIATLRTGSEPRKGRARNVIGILPGTDPELKDEYIIVGAHYDHLGYGETGSRTGANLIHYGADDNASGTAGIIALAKHFAESKDNKRTLIFQCYSAEEEGLLGSNAWALKNPEILKNTTAMINMDMIGRVRENKLTVHSVSSADEWPEILGALSPGSLVIEQQPNVRADSDQYSFARYNVPVLAIFSGLHSEYHTENDTPDTLNYDGMVQTLDYVAQLIRAVDAREKLTFSQNAVMGNAAGDRSTSRRIRVGFIPDMGATGPGAAISGTSPNSPAEKAGLKAGDRIIEFNGVKVEDLETLNEAMKTCQPGDKVKVVFLREGKQMQVELVVEERIG